MADMQLRSKYEALTVGSSNTTAKSTLDDCPRIHLNDAQCEALGFKIGAIPSPGTELSATVHCLVASAMADAETDGKPTVRVSLYVKDMVVTSPVKSINLYA
jgi:hypothetical protein